MQDNLQTISTLRQYLIPELKEPVREIIDELEEIRIRIGRPIILKTFQGERFITTDGRITKTLQNPLIAGKDTLDRELMLISRSSFYALDEELKKGYITVAGGHRIGLCGKGVLASGEIKNIKYINSINIRIARQVKGIGEKLLPHISTNNNINHTLIVSPPGKGKTTMLRDIVRILSEKGYDVGVVDERSEIAGCYEGVPQLDVGIRTDVLDGCPKKDGIIMLIRSMTPQIIATDEIGTNNDMFALMEALKAGVKVIATAHGSTYEEISKRPNVSSLIKKGFFKRIIFLDRKGKNTIITEIYDDTGKKIWEVEQ